jgi:hypothetical protein
VVGGAGSSLRICPGQTESPCPLPPGHRPADNAAAPLHAPKVVFEALSQNSLLRSTRLPAEVAAAKVGREEGVTPSLPYQTVPCFAPVPKRFQKLVVSLAVVLLAVAVTAIWYFFRQPPLPTEPSYKGTPLSTWIRSIRAPDLSPPETLAIQAMGTNSIPHLLAWMRYDPPVREFHMRAYWAFLTGSHTFSNRLVLGNNAPIAFQALGSTAEPAIPELLSLMTTNWDWGLLRGRALTALAKIGKPALPALLDLFTNTNNTKRVHDDACIAIGMMGTNALPAIPILTQLLGEQRLIQRVSFVLACLKLEPSLVIPALTNVLFDPHPGSQVSAAWALEYLGPAASNAIPYLKILLSHPDTNVQAAAASALLNIDPKALTNSPSR